MTDHDDDAPAWLIALQGEVGRMLRTPLDPTGGRWHPRPDVAPPSLLRRVRRGTGPPPADRLALYQEQYWQRLFEATQDSFPRFVRAAGAWAFNHLVTEHLASGPIRARDLSDVADGLGRRILGALRALDAGEPDDTGWRGPLAACTAPRLLLRQALYIDDAERAAFRAPWAGVWKPTADELAGVAERRLPLSPGTAVVREDYDLVAWPSRPRDTALPARLSGGRDWVVSRTADGTAVRLVDPIEAALLRLAHRHPLGEALERLASTAGPRERAALAERLPDYVRGAIERGWWSPPERRAR